MKGSGMLEYPMGDKLQAVVNKAREVFINYVRACDPSEYEIVKEQAIAITNGEQEGFNYPLLAEHLQKDFIDDVSNFFFDSDVTELGEILLTYVIETSDIETELKKKEFQKGLKATLEYYEDPELEGKNYGETNIESIIKHIFRDLS